MESRLAMTQPEGTTPRLSVCPPEEGNGLDRLQSTARQVNGCWGTEYSPPTEGWQASPDGVVVAGVARLTIAPSPLLPAISRSALRQ